MTIEQLKTFFVEHGYTQDNYGHYQKTLTLGDRQTTYRYKIQSISIRKEFKCHHTDGSNEWVRIASNYISKLSLNDKNQLVGLK
jgi:hypothetical protein